MALSAKFVRRQIERFRTIFVGSSLENARRGQALFGTLLAKGKRKSLVFERHFFPAFEGIWCIPREETRHAVLLYLHGGGYCCGNRSYARGVASFMATRWGVRVFAAVYRLAPEHPFPAACEDALEAYRYLLSSGYAPEEIVVCGESAGGGMAFSLCLSLAEQGIPLPAALLTVSPWTDLTMSGPSYEENAARDPSMTRERLAFFAARYTTKPEAPLASPLFADLPTMPPSLTFVGEHEIMRSDAVSMHNKLLQAGADSTLYIGKEMWHAYLLYGMRECEEDYKRISRFFERVLPRPRKLRWLPLDNAAKIYPASRSRNWANNFRVSATLCERVDTEVLRHALDVTARRFPSISVRLDKGFFWYYLEELSSPPEVRRDAAYPLRVMRKGEVKKCALRVLVYERRIALEFFHAITDGNGCLAFLKNLLAEYAEQKYGLSVPLTHGILDRRALPDEEEIEDAFQKNCTGVAMSRREQTAYHPKGTKRTDGFVHLVNFRLSAAEVIAAAKARGLTVTAYLTAALMLATAELQKEQVPSVRRRRPIKVLLPVNLRRLFPSRTLRNFVLYVTPSIDPRMGEYTFEEICECVRHQMGMEITPKRMSARITTNINSEKSLFIKLMPLFIKNAVMKMVFLAVGEKKCSFTFSNLGAVTLPSELGEHVARFDFVLNVPATTPYNVSAISYGDVMNISFVRRIEESCLERHFYDVLTSLGLSPTLESNAEGARFGFLRGGN